jgi:glycosyltransferase involved in cell wall biosynthesis
MAYAMATVGAIVSTPYLYAQEVLASGRGLLVPFADSHSLAEATIRYLSDPQLMAETRRRAYRYAQSMFWPRVGRQYLSLFSQVIEDRRPLEISTSYASPSVDSGVAVQTLLKK